MKLDTSRGNPGEWPEIIRTDRMFHSGNDRRKRTGSEINRIDKKYRVTKMNFLKGVNDYMKVLKKTGSIMLAFMMIAMAGLACAGPANMNNHKGVIGEFTSADTPVVQDNAVLIYKEITAYNKDNKTVNAPVLTYSYTVTPVDGGKTITDAGGNLHGTDNSVTVQTKKGLAGATIAGSVDGTTYTNGILALTNSVQLNTADDGQANKFPLKIDFSGVSWTGAGVYRYQIAETTTSEAKAAAGVSDGGISGTLYMDVYVKDGTTSGNYVIYGYTCFKSNSDIYGRTSTSNLTTIQKTEGFVSGDSDGDGTIESDEQADKYYTFNLEISKTLTGDQTMNGNKFPFNVNFTNSSVTAAIFLKQETTAGGGITANLPAAAGVNSLDVTDLGLANGAKVKYIGIPAGVTAVTTVAVYEKNNVTGTVYKSSYSIDGGTASSPKSIAKDASSDTATLNTITKDDADHLSHTIAFTNTLEQISPTGIVTRYAPYGLILVAGVVLLVISKKHKKHSEDD